MVILDKIINDLKAKLPFLKKPEEEGDELEENLEADESSREDDVTGATDLSALEDTDEEEGVASNASLIHKLKAKIQSLNAKPTKTKKASATEDESPAEDDEAAKKKKRSRIIQGVIGLALLAFLAEDYIVPKEEPIEAPVPPPIARKRPEPKPADQATTPTEPAAEPTTTEPATTETTPSEVTPAETTPTDAVATEPAPSTETLPDSPVDVTSTEIPSEPATETPSESISTAPETTTEEPAPDTTITETPSEVTPPSSVDSIDGETTTADENLTDQILQDLEKQAKSTEPKEAVTQYVSPPDYDYRGRGLVYNCSGKHWACVDAPSFKLCEDNASSTKFLKKTMECHPVNIYETQKGCENIQNRMVSTSAKTTFCN